MDEATEVVTQIEEGKSGEKKKKKKRKEEQRNDNGRTSAPTDAPSSSPQQDDDGSTALAGLRFFRRVPKGASVLIPTGDAFEEIFLVL